MKVYDIVVYKSDAYSEHPQPNAPNEAKKTSDTHDSTMCQHDQKISTFDGPELANLRTYFNLEDQYSICKGKRTMR